MRNSQTLFSDLPTISAPRAKHQINQEIKLTGNVGDVIPFYNCEVLPGDSFKINTSKVFRLTTPITPFMDNLRLDTYYFFIPNRLIWSHWQNFMGESEAAWYDSGVQYTIPQIVADDTNGWTKGGIADYLGYPTDIPGYKCSALPIRAYAKLIDDWFLNKATQDPLLIPVGDSDQTGVNGKNNYIEDIANGGDCFVANKLRDYFVSALPQPQFGDPVSIQLGELSGHVFGNGKVLGFETYLSEGDNPTLLGSMLPSNTSSIGAFKTNYGKSVDHTSPSGTGVGGNHLVGLVTKETIDSLDGGSYDDTGLVADITGGNLITINELRMAFTVQRMQEALARGGNRYIEIIHTLFGVTSPDARLQRSEYLGGNSIPVVVNQVLQGDVGATPLGTTGAYSLTVDSNFDVDKSFTEHGYVIGVCVMRYKHTYQQGAARHLLRKTKEEFFNPLMANIGEQGIKNAEIFAQGSSVVNPDTGKAYDDEIFGYQEAWSEYRMLPNRTAGEMRSTYSTPLDMWHLGDDYSSLPMLSNEWTREAKDNVDRVLTVKSTNSDQFIADIYVQNEAIRAVPQYSIPGLMSL